MTLDSALGLKIEDNSKMIDFLKATERIALIFLYLFYDLIISVHCVHIVNTVMIRNMLYLCIISVNTPETL